MPSNPGSTASPAPACDESPDPLNRLLRISDDAAPANEAPDAARSRRLLLLDMLAASPRCYVENPTDDQLREIMNNYRALPVGQVLAGGLNNRFFAGGSAWVDNGPIGSPGRAARASLRYSFPSDAAWWRDSANGLNAAFSTQFGAANIDRGREYVRQALASWRRVAGLSYIEVLDPNIDFTNSTVLGGGDIRIGASFQGATSGVLAYNFYPDGGGDMAINIDQMTPTSLFNPNNNYRYFRNVVAHEHGHGLGFAHPVPCNQTKLMEPFASSAFEMTQIDEIRGSQLNYGDRYAGNNSFANAKDFGSLTSPIVKSILERSLSTNGATGPNATNEDWFKFSIGSTQNVVITIAPTGGSYLNAAQDTVAGGCNPTTQPTVNAQQAGNLNVELRDSTGATILTQASSAAAGSNEVITRNGLAAGTYSIRVVDAGPNPVANQVLQLYDMTIRVGTSRAAPQAIAGVTKRIAVGALCYFMGDLNSRVTETGATLNNASYDWDLDGNGTFETNDTPQPTRTYTVPGQVNVTLRVTDSNNMVATDTITVYVGGSLPTIASITPSAGQIGTTVPVTITGSSLFGVATASQVMLSSSLLGSGVSVIGTPSVSPDGATVTGLSFVVAVNANTGGRDLTISNADGTGQSASSLLAFQVTSIPPANDTCITPISWGSATGLRPFSNIAATTGTPQSFPGTGCPTAGPINNDVWYSWTAPSNGNLNISCDSATTGMPNLFSSRVAAYEAGACPPSPALGCNDFGAAFNIAVLTGRTYLIQVGSTNTGFWGAANVNLQFTPVVGACCDTAGNCTSQPSNLCTGTSYWQGAGTTCELFPCENNPQGTCCAPNGSCQSSDLFGCTAGVFSPGGSCTPNPCTQPSGSCCAASGACVELEQAACDGGRTWTLDAVCTPNPCPQPQGACCAAIGSCASTTQAACAGSWQGADTSCTPNPCPQPQGACCAADGSCTQSTEAACAGSWQGAATPCTPNPCPQPQGACCAADGSCGATTQSACTGSWQGPATTCSPNPCPQPQGACCAADGSCAATTQSACTGSWQGAETTCSPNPCPQPQGACCNAASCSISTEAACTSGGGVFQGAAVACGAPGNPTTCCPANFNAQTGVTVQDIFDFLGAYFANLPTADFNASGGITVQDIFDFLGAYFTGCPG